MNTKVENEIEVLFSEFRAKVIKVAVAERDHLRSMIDGSFSTEAPAKRNRKRAKPRKPRRGVRHCAKCGSTNHDARNCKRKGKGKVAILEVAKAA